MSDQKASAQQREKYRMRENIFRHICFKQLKIIARGRRP
jgi:hypothetical protein